MTEGRVPEGKASADTSSSLLFRIRQKEPEAWTRFVPLYTPLIKHWCYKSGLSEADAADICQDVFGAVDRAIGKYQHDQKGSSFRGWLRTITSNKIHDLFRRRDLGIEAVGGSDALAQMMAVPESEPQDSGDGQANEDELIVFRQAIELILSEFKDETRRAFLRVVVDEASPADVATELGITVNAVYLAKSRVKRRFKEEFSGLIESI